jgi:cytochrome c biogenesis protein ResB
MSLNRAALPRWNNLFWLLGLNAVYSSVRWFIALWSDDYSEATYFLIVALLSIVLAGWRLGEHLDAQKG